MNETEQFLKDTEIEKSDILTETLNPETEAKTPEKEIPAEDTEMKAKNRRERRLLKHNQELREEAIALNARLEAVSEVEKLRQGTDKAEYLKRVEKIYGTATPETAEATKLLQEAMEGLKESVKQEALAEYETRQANESQAVAKEEQTLESILEDIEEEHNVDLTSEEGAENRRGFLTLLEKLSPKDKEGNIIEYADPDTVYELYSSRQTQSNSRAKELASRSMTRGGQTISKVEDDANLRYLKEQGIL